MEAIALLEDIRANRQCDIEIVESLAPVKPIHDHSLRPTCKLFDAAKYFKTLDTDGNGFIDRDELSASLIASGIPVTNALLTMIIKKMDTAGDGQISVDEFLRFSEDQNIKLKVIFETIDIA